MTVAVAQPAIETVTELMAEEELRADYLQLRLIGEADPWVRIDLYEILASPPAPADVEREPLRELLLYAEHCAYALTRLERRVTPLHIEEPRVEALTILSSREL